MLVMIQYLGRKCSSDVFVCNYYSAFVHPFRRLKRAERQNYEQMGDRTQVAAVTERCQTVSKSNLFAIEKAEQPYIMDAVSTEGIT